MCDAKKICNFQKQQTTMTLNLYVQTLLEVKRLKKIGTEGLERIEHFYLSQPITLHPQNSIFFYLRIYPE